VASFVARLPATPQFDEPFDLVFVDPPYDTANAEVTSVLEALANRGVLGSGATIVMERGRSDAPLTVPAGWQIEKERSYGDTLIVVATA